MVEEVEEEVEEEEEMEELQCLLNKMYKDQFCQQSTRVFPLE